MVREPVQTPSESIRNIDRSIERELIGDSKQERDGGGGESNSVFESTDEIPVPARSPPEALPRSESLGPSPRHRQGLLRPRVAAVQGGGLRAARSPDAVTRVVEVPPVLVKENDVCVRMLAAPINPSDINSIEGVYPVRPQLPAVGGREGVGEVHLVGSAVKDLSPGDLVIPSPLSFGTWQTYIVKDQSVWQKIDKNSPIEYAATISINPPTALRMLEDFTSLEPGDSIVQNGATSMVG